MNNNKVSVCVLIGTNLVRIGQRLDQQEKESLPEHILRDEFVCFPSFFGHIPLCLLFSFSPNSTSIGLEAG
ncbi:hypothetical protein JXQ70_04315 [bacterium]|nr:hypothetical protein [bacterium]